MELCGHHREAAATGAGDWVLRNLPRNYGEGYFYYALYYTSQGMFHSAAITGKPTPPISTR